MLLQLQAPFMHLFPTAHTIHTLPMLPHAVSSVPGRQSLPLQQPSHTLESHTHVPFEQ
jgi:hypothetical protein